MASRFGSYVVSPNEKIYVKKRVLFGDLMDTALSNLNKKRNNKFKKMTTNAEYLAINSVEGSYTHAKIYLTGYYEHGKLYSTEDVTHKKMLPHGPEGRYLHLIHLDHLDGNKLGKYLCQVDGMDDSTNEFIWSRYDWCQYRNDDVGEELDDDDDYYRQIHFVSVDSDGQKIGQITMDEQCLEGEWCNGLRLVDKNSGLTFAYVFGDALVNDAFQCFDSKDLLQHSENENPLLVPIENFNVE